MLVGACNQSEKEEGGARLNKSKDLEPIDTTPNLSPVLLFCFFGLEADGFFKWRGTWLRAALGT